MLRRYFDCINLPTTGARCCVAALAAGLVALALLVPAASADQRANTGSTSAESRNEAIRALPLRSLEPNVRQKVAEVVSDPSLYRQTPVEVTACDPEMFQFLLRNPELVVNLWELMGISNVKLIRTGETTFRAADANGTVCNIQLVYGDHQQHVVYAEGVCSGPLLGKPIHVRCVLVIRSGFVREADGRYFVSGRMDTFIKVENAAVELIARTLKSIVVKSTDENFSESLAFVGKVSRTAEKNPDGMKRLSGRLAKVQPEVLKQFDALTDRVAERASQAQVQRTNYRDPAAGEPRGRPIPPRP